MTDLQKWAIESILDSLLSGMDLSHKARVEKDPLNEATLAVQAKSAFKNVEDGLRALLREDDE